MKIRPLTVGGAFEITPVQHGDPRGLFLEWYRADLLAAELGHGFRPVQGNMSVSARGVVRGVHFADVPPGQAKYVTCVRGAVLDVVVDVRVGSPTFGRWEGVRLDTADRRAVYISEGIGHGFCALTDDATLFYLVSTGNVPEREHGVHPLDPRLGIEWPTERPVVSDRDRAAPSLDEAAAAGVLPRFEKCLSHAESLRRTVPN